MASKTAILSVRITGNSKGGVGAITRTAAAVTGLDKAAKRARTALPKLIASAPKIAVAASAIASLAAVAVSGAGSLFSLAVSLAGIAPAALALPGVLAGAGLAVVTLVLALKDAGTVLADLGPRFTALQDSVSSAFWERAEAPIRSLVDNLLPTLSSGMSSIASELGGMFTAISGALGSDLGVGQIGSILEKVSSALNIAGDGAGVLTSSLLTLTNVGASYLPALAGAALAAAAAVAFAAFLQASGGSFAEVGYYFDPTRPTAGMADAASAVAAQAPLLWIGAVAVGGILPLAAAFMGRRSGSWRLWGPVAIVCALIGAVCLRVVFYELGLSVFMFY